MPARQLPETFLVSFSFAGEQRDLVCAIAEVVEDVVGQPNVFLDEWFEHYIAGDDADLRLREIYGERSALVVVCISERYGDKPWTRAEHAAIRARLMQARSAGDKRAQLGILPIRVGDGDIEGIPFNTIVPDVRGLTPAQTAKLIVERLRLVSPDVVAASEEPLPSSPIARQAWGH